MELVDTSQHFKREPQVVAAAYYFHELCEHFKISPTEVFTIVSNIEKHFGEEGNAEMNAAKLYIQHEL